MIEAFISGQAARVAFVQGTEATYIRADEPLVEHNVSLDDVKFLFGSATDIEHKKIDNPKEVLNTLLEKYNLDRGTHFFDASLDQTLSNELRVESALAFSDIISETKSLSNLRNFAFSVYNEDLAQVDNQFEELFASTPQFVDFVRELLSAQSHILALHETLRRSFEVNCVNVLMAEQFLSISIAQGIFRALVEAKSNGNAMNPAIMQAHFSLKDFPIDIIKGWTKPFIDRPARKKLRELEKEQLQYEKEEKKHKTKDQRSIHNKYTAVREQQDHIVEKIKLGDFKSARKFTDQLISLQLLDGTEYAAKTLTNLARKARDIGAQSLELEWAERAVEIAPTDGYATGLLADTHLSLYQYDKARLAFLKTGECGEEQFSEVGIARLLKQSGKLDEAKDHFNLLLSKKIDDQSQKKHVWIGYISTLRDLWNLDEAHKACEKAISIFPHEEIFKSNLAAVLSLLGKTDESLLTYDEIINKTGGEPMTHYGKAITLSKLGQFEEAKTVLESVVSKFPDNVHCAVGYAQILNENGHHEKSNVEFKRCIAKFAYSPLPYAGYGEALRDAGEIAESIKIYEEAKTKFRLDPTIRNGYANLLKVKYELKGSLREYDNNVKDFPNDIRSLSGRADLLRRLGYFDEALEAYDAIIEKFPRYGAVSISKAAVLVAQKKYDEANELLPKSAPRTEDDWVAYHIKGMIALQQKQYDEATKIFDTGMKKNPFHRSRKYFRTALASTYLRRNDHEKSIALLENPKEPVEHIILAHAYASFGDKNRANSIFEAMNDNFPHYAQELQKALTMKFQLLPIVGKEVVDDWIYEEEERLILRAA